MSVWEYKDIFFKNVMCTDNSRFDMAGVLPGAREKICRLCTVFCTSVVSPTGLMIVEQHNQKCVFKT